MHEPENASAIFQVEDKFGLKFSMLGDDSEDFEGMEVRTLKRHNNFTTLLVFNTGKEHIFLCITIFFHCIFYVSNY